MESNNNSEIKGNLSEHLLAELLAETRDAKLSGSFRLSSEDKKAVVYLKTGKVVFIASNSREHRLFEMLLREGKITKPQLVAIKNFTNDLQLRQIVIAENIFSAEEIDEIISRQIEEILREIIIWKTGNWTFSHLARIKDDIEFEINTDQILLNHSRGLVFEDSAKKFVNPKQSFGKNPSQPSNLDLMPSEAFLMSRFEKSFMNLTEIHQLSGLPEDVTRKNLYVLWLGGFIFRQNWNAVFSEKKISEILSARISLVNSVEEETKQEKEDISIKTKPLLTEEENVKAENTEENSKEKTINESANLEKYLERVEHSTNHYELMDILPQNSAAEIKTAYFYTARNFHPDIFHKKVEPELHLKIQQAFTKIAQAYDVLKNEKSKQLYDYKMHKELEEMKQLQEQGVSGEDIDKHKQRREAKDFFQQGFDLLLDDQAEKAIPFLAKAVQLDNNNARFYAYFGKALSCNSTQLHKAESELQTAIRLDPENVSYKLMLAEFFVQINLLTRAKGELKRLLQKSPNNAEAKKLFDSLQNS